jgi:hypothetical protein
MPIRRKGTGPAPAEPADAAAGEGDAAAAEGEAVAEAAPVAPAAPVDPNAPLELLDVKVEGPVVYVQLPAMRAATTTYTGPSPGLPRIRDLTKAWAMVRGAATWDRPFEEYLDPIKDMLSEEAQFRVFWPVKTGDVEPAAAVIIAPLPTDPAAEGATGGEAEAAPAEAPETPAAA